MRTSIFISIGAALLFLILPGGYPPLAGGEASGGVSKANLDLPFEAAGEDGEEEQAPEIIVFYGQRPPMPARP